MKVSTEDERCQYCGVNRTMSSCECGRIAELEAENARLRALVERGADSVKLKLKAIIEFENDCRKELQNNVRNHQVSDKGNS